MKQTPDQKLVDLLTALPEGAVLDHYVQHQHTLELFVNWNEPKRGERVCPHCFSNRCVKKTAALIRLLDIFHPAPQGSSSLSTSPDSYAKIVVILFLSNQTG